MSELTRVRRQLAHELARLQDLAGLSSRKLRDQVGVSQPTVSRIARGTSLPTMPVVLAWLGATGAPDETRERVLALTEAAHGETRPWGELLHGREHLQDDVRERNEASTRIRNFQPTVIPGLLQTADYAKRVFELGHTPDVPAAVTARLDGQQILYAPGRRFEFLIAEHVWSHQHLAEGQRDRVYSVATLNNVDIAILPEGGALSWHNFVIRDPADGGPVYVTTELVHGRQVITDPDSVELYGALWDRMWAASRDLAD